MTENHKYVGRLVMVERAFPDDAYTRSYDGEKLVLAATPNQLFTIPMSGYSSGINAYGLGNGWSSGSQVPLTGLGHYNVLSVDPIPNWIFEQLDVVEKDCRECLDGTRKAQWVTGIYHQALTNIAKIRAFKPKQEERAPQAVLTYDPDYAPLPRSIRLEVGSKSYLYHRA